MAKEIKQKIVLDGEAEYKKALKEARTELGRLKGEMKAEAAEAERNATASEKAAKKQEALKKQIAEQEKIVKTLSKALEEAKSKYSDNAEVIAKWENQYNAARTTLAGMKNELDDVTSGFKSMKSDVDMGVVATKSFADALGEIGSVGENISGAIEDVFMGVVSTIREAVEELWTMVVDTAGKANGWADEAEFWGTDAATIQQWEHAVKSAHNEFTSLTDVATRLTLGGKDKEVAEYLGLSSENYEDQWAFSIEALNELQRLKNEDTQKYYEAMGEIFGQRRAKNVMDLVNDWDQIKGFLPQFDAENGGTGLGNEGIGFMSDFATKLDAIRETAEALQDMFAGTFAKMTLGMVVEAQGALDAIGKYMTSDDPQAKQDALDELREHVETFFTEAAKVIEECIGILYDVGKDLQQSDDPLVQLIGKIMTDLANALQWMIDNQDKVKEAFEAIFGIWLIAKLGAVAGKLRGIIAQIEVIKAFKATSLAAETAGGAAAASAAGAATGMTFGGMAASLGLTGAVIMGTQVAPAVVAAQYAQEHPEIYVGNKEYVQTADYTQEDIENMNAWIDAQNRMRKINEMYFEPGADMEELGTEYEKLAGIVGALNGIEGTDLFKKYWDYANNAQFSTEDALPLLEEVLGSEAVAAVATEAATEAVSKLPIVNDPDYWTKIKEKEEEAVSENMSALTEEQIKAAEDFWDIFRNNPDDFTDEEYERFENAFIGSESLFDKIDQLMNDLASAEDNANWRNMEDLPANWWLNADQWTSGNSITGADLRGFQGLPAQMTAAVAAGASAGVSGIKVTLDGAAVGAMVAPYVSQYVSRDIVV